MLHGRTLNNRINIIYDHGRTLRLTYKCSKSSFKELLEKDHSVKVHHKNFEMVVIYIFNVKNDSAHDIMKDVVRLKERPYNLRSESNPYTRRNIKTNHHGLLPVKHIPPRIWQLVPQSVRKCKTFNKFKDQTLVSKSLSV